jgi:hypothetical protein
MSGIRDSADARKTANLITEQDVFDWLEPVMRDRRLTHLDSLVAFTIAVSVHEGDAELFDNDIVFRIGGRCTTRSIRRSRRRLRAAGWMTWRHCTGQANVYTPMVTCPTHSRGQAS